MGIQLFTNNAETKLTTAITPDNYVIAVQYGDVFPLIVDQGLEDFTLTLEDDQGNMEIVRVTNRTGNALTVFRAQEGTTARAFPANTNISLRLTAKFLEDASSDLNMVKQKAFAALKNTGGTVTGDIIRSGSQSGFYRISIPSGNIEGGGLAIIPQSGGKSVEVSYLAGGGVRIFIEEKGNVAEFKNNGEAKFASTVHAGDAWLGQNGQVYGNIWKDWHSSGLAKTAISARIEQRAAAIAEAKINALVNGMIDAKILAFRTSNPVFQGGIKVVGKVRATKDIEAFVPAVQMDDDEEEE